MFKCPHCAKPYSKKSGQDAHEPVCGILQQSKTEFIDMSSDDVPSSLQLYKIIAIMSKRLKHLEYTVAQQQLFINRHTSTSVVVKWLNSDLSQKPTIMFKTMLSRVSVLPQDILYLKNESCIQTISTVICREFKCGNGLSPIISFKKPGNIYIYDNSLNENALWREITKAEFKTMIACKIEILLIAALTQWNNEKNCVEGEYDRLLLKITNKKISERNITTLMGKMHSVVKRESMI